MKPKLITFDCAQTLVEVSWSPASFALEIAQALGLAIDPSAALSTYGRLLQGRWEHYKQLNCTRDHKLCEGFWLELTQDWLSSLGQDPAAAASLVEHGSSVMYGPGSPIFRLFPDTLPVLDRLREEGYKLAIISNWDYSLHRVLAMFDLTEKFDVVIASLEEGIEKPEAEIFHIALGRAGISFDQAIHVGDDPLDDVHGARAVGMRALLIDRRRPMPAQGVITSLDQLPEVLESIV